MQEPKRHIKNILLFAGILLFLIPLHGQEEADQTDVEISSEKNDSIVFFPLLRLKGPAHIPILISNLLENKYLQRGNFNVIRQSDINSILYEKRTHLAIERCNEKDCALEMARYLNAGFAFMGTVSTEENHIEINGWLFNVASGKKLLSINKHVYDTNDLDISAEIIVRQIGRVLFPDYEATFGIPNPEENVLPTTPILEKDVKKGPSENAPLDKPSVGGQYMALNPEKESVFSWNSVGLISGVSFLNAAGLLNYISETNLYSYRQAFEEYSEAEIVQSALNAWERSDKAYDSAMGLRYSAIGSAGAGLSLSGAGLWISNEPFLYMSGIGHVLFNTGLMLQISSHFLDMLSLQALGESQKNYLLYINEENTPGLLWDEVLSADEEYRSLNAAAYSVKGIGTLLTVGGAFFKGEKPYINGFWDRVFVSSAMLFWTGGNVSMSNALSLQRDMEWAQYKYLRLENGSTLFDDRYNDYVSKRDDYQKSFIITNSLWGSSALLFLSAVVLDIPDPFKTKRESNNDETVKINPLSFSVMPGVAGPVFLWRLML